MAQFQPIIRIFYRLFGLLFLVLGVLTLLVAILRFKYPLILSPWLLLSYTAMNFITFWGFWKYRRWLLTILSINFLTVLVFGIIKLISNGYNTSTLAPIIIAGLLALFVYSNKKILNDNYFNVKFVIPFAIFWIVSIFINYI